MRPEILRALGGPTRRLPSALCRWTLVGKKKKAVQSEPPRVGLGKLFPSGVFPTGQEVEYPNEWVATAVREVSRC